MIFVMHLSKNITTADQ